MNLSFVRSLPSLSSLSVLAVLVTGCPADPEPGTSDETGSSGDGDGDASGDGDGDSSGDGDGDASGDGDGDASGDGDGDASGDGDGDTSGDGDGDTSGDGDGDASGDGDGDPGEGACEECIYTTCEAPLSACEADAVCDCWINCDGDEATCTEECGPANELTQEAGVCLQSAGIGACAEVCITDPCDVCVFEACGAAYEECIADPVCWCQIDCDPEDGECLEACGPESPDHGALLECLVGADESCADACA